MEFFWIIVYTFTAYLIGSIPTSLWFGKLYYGLDIRDHGNGTSSHLNVKAILGRRSSFFIRILDFAKGILAARLAVPLSHQIDWMYTDETYILGLTLGLAAILGHIFPLFTSFNGGKGYYVALGVLIVAHPAIMSIFLGVTVLTYVVSRNHYLSYMIGAISLPLFIFMTRTVWYDRFLPMMIFGLGVFALLLMTHYRSLRQSPVRLRRPDLRIRHLFQRKF